MPYQDATHQIFLGKSMGWEDALYLISEGWWVKAADLGHRTMCGSLALFCGPDCTCHPGPLSLEDTSLAMKGTNRKVGDGVKPENQRVGPQQHLCCMGQERFNMDLQWALRTGKARKTDKGVRVKCTLFPHHPPLNCCFLVAKSCLALCNLMDCSSPGSSVQGIFQARSILEWVAIYFSRGSSWPRDRTYTSCIGRQILYR